MSSLLIGLLGAIVATNQPAAISNLVEQTTGISIRVPDPNDPLEKELEKLKSGEKAARDEVDGWIIENQQFAAKGAGIPAAELNQRIRKRFEAVRTGYEDFIKLHPDYAKVRVEFARFLLDMGDEDGLLEQLNKALELDPKDADTWNELANHHGHRGPIKTAFAYYEKAIQLNPAEPVYYQNFGTTVYLFRKDAVEYYGITEQQVFDKALDLYAKALKLDPTNFPLATDLAQSYYGIKPVRTEDALRAWTNALNIASDEIEREGVYLHLARFKAGDGRFAEARAHLDAVTDPTYAVLKNRLTRSLEEKEKLASDTNGPPVAASTDPAMILTNSTPPMP